MGGSGGGTLDPESVRLEEDAARVRNWKRFGPYLAERQWGTVREDYSADQNPWTYFTHDHARSRAYRWGEDGLMGFCDRQGRMCFALALWNGQDPILKERLYGLTGPEGNHGEDVKELYYYLDSTPTHSYCKALYKYPQRAFPYAELVTQNQGRGRLLPEYELADTGVLEGDRYFDVFVEYAKAAPEDILVQITVANRGPAAAPLWLLPTLWFRNVWSWGRQGEGYGALPRLTLQGDALHAVHPGLGSYSLRADAPVQWLFTENESNTRRLFGRPNASPYLKDAFHEYLVKGKKAAVNPAHTGTKAGALQILDVPAAGQRVLRLRLTSLGEDGGLGGGARPSDPFADFERVLSLRKAEADAFYQARLGPGDDDPDCRAIARQGYAGLLWSKQFYHYDLQAWLEGDPAHPPPPEGHRYGPNNDWQHLYNRDVLSMPDKWEYPWYAAWDLAFHMIPFSRVDPTFAKDQLLLLLREWYMHPNGQLPAYEFGFGDVNPPVHAWAAWRVYKIAVGPDGQRDRAFLKRVFHKLLINFTWWVNRKDAEGKNIFSGGFLGLDNVGVFDRSKPLPTGGHLEQADGTAWMAFYSATMLSMALELAKADFCYEDMASKFFEHFVGIADAINTVGGTGLWDQLDGFYYDKLNVHGHSAPLRVRSMVGLLPLIAVEVLEDEVLDRLPSFKKRMQWFLENRRDLAAQVSCGPAGMPGGKALLAIPSRERLERVLRYLLDPEEFLSPFGIRSLSRMHERSPYRYFHEGQEFRVDYAPGESRTGDFGGNSNWRGPLWFPVNYLLIEALERYHHFFGDDLRVECPVGSGRMLNLQQVSRELASRLTALFRRDGSGARPCHGGERRYAEDPHFRELLLFHEYFHAETGRGLGASHQGWTTLVLRFLEEVSMLPPPAPTSG